MSRTRRIREKGADTPPPESNLSRLSTRLSEQGMLTVAEVAITAAIIALLLLTGITVLRYSEKATVTQKNRFQALELAKQQVEDIKRTIQNQPWDQIKVDVQFPPTQTPAVPPYNSYSAVTVKLENSNYVVEPMVRYVVQHPGSDTVDYVPTPGNYQTPEISDMVRIKADVFYGPTKEYIPWPTVEPQALANPSFQARNRVQFQNYVSNNSTASGGFGNISGSVRSNGNNPIQGAEVDAVDGTGLKLAGDFTNAAGIFNHLDLPIGPLNLTVLYPGYVLQSQNFSNPLTLTTSGLSNKNFVLRSVPVETLHGVVYYSTPRIDVFPPGTATPTPNPLYPVPTLIPAPNPVLVINDGNSSPVTGDGAGNFSVPNVLSTPAANRTPVWYDLNAQINAATPIAGDAYFNLGNSSSSITIYLNKSALTTTPVTFLIYDDNNNPITWSYFWPMTLTAADGRAPVPQTILSTPVTQVIFPVNPGPVNVSVAFAKPSPTVQPYAAFNGTLNIAASVTAPVTLTNQAVGSVNGMVYGLGSFDYTQFLVDATDDLGQFEYRIPVTWSSGATFGGFSFQYARTGSSGPGTASLNYNFQLVTGSDYNSINDSDGIIHNRMTTIGSNLQVYQRNAYVSFFVKKSSQIFQDGALVAAVAGSGVSLPSTLGQGATVANYYSSSVGATGATTMALPILHPAPTPNTYTFWSYLSDSTTGNPLSQTVSGAPSTLNVKTNPLPITFLFP